MSYHIKYLEQAKTIVTAIYIHYILYGDYEGIPNPYAPKNALEKKQLIRTIAR